MPRDVIITPLSGLIDFKDLSGNNDAFIQINDSGDLTIGNPGGTLSIGNLASNLYIGDGTNSVDIIFEQNGKIRGLTNRTLTLGQSDSYVTTASPFGFLSPDGTKQITARMLNTDVLSFQGGAGELLSLSDSMTGTIFSVNDVSGIPSIEVIDTGLIKLGQYGGNILLGTGTDNATDKLQVNGSISGTVLKSNIAVGTAPLTVVSTTKVTNLNADLLDGANLGTSWTDVTGGTIPVRHGSGYLYSNYFNTPADITATSPSHVAIQTASDNYIRWQTLAQFKTSLAISGGQFFGSAATKAIAYNSNTISENVSVTAGNNGLSAGPITIANGFTVTVANGATWVIV
jgi:hypothetical protein